MSSIRCRFGWHDWMKWQPTHLHPNTCQKRFCWRCGIEENRMIPINEQTSKPKPEPVPAKSFDEEMGWCTDVNCMRTEPHAPH